MKVAIMGGGASALMCASFVKNHDVTIFESAEKYGKKILATGNGRCNLTNLNMSKYSYNIDISKYFEKVSVGDSLEFFNKIGLEFFVDEENRVYPLSNNASSVLSVLKNYVETKKNIKIETNKQILDVFSEKNGYKLQFSDNLYEFFDVVIIASGNYTNLKIFDKFNIKYKNFVPSLCSIKTKPHKNLSGVRVDNVKVVCKTNNINFEEIGEILFKDDGISGIVVFNLSSHMARINNFNNEIILDFLPKAEFEDLVNILIERKDALCEYNADEFLTGFFNKQINLEFLKRAGVKLNKKVGAITKNEILEISKNIKEFKLSTFGYFENNQVKSGGIFLEELDDNLQSKEHENLYFIGEVVNVDGVCGGYNLQWAWTSGQIVGESL